ncbi:MAG: hypothetical protein ACKOX7_05285, partial [Bacteroidota bacterium]
FKSASRHQFGFIPTLSMGSKQLGNAFVGVGVFCHIDFYHQGANKNPLFRCLSYHIQKPPAFFCDDF